MLSRRNQSSKRNEYSKGNNSSNGDRSPPVDAARGRTAGRFGWTAFGFIMGVGVWHAVGFWSFVTAVTLTGKPPERASITAAVLTPDALVQSDQIQSDQIDPPKPVPVTRTQERAAWSGTARSPEPVEQSPPALPQLQTAEQPASAVPRPTGGTIVFAQPGLNSPTGGAETAPPQQPDLTTPAERTAPPSTTPAPSGESSWSTRIITGAID
jgi:hypothetical protein